MSARATSSAPALRLAVIGEGKMGRAIAALAEERGWSVVARIGPPRPGDAGGAGGGASVVTRATLAGADVAVEFTTPSAAAANIRACLAAGCPVVVGTTGWYDALPAIAEEVRRAGGALLWASNFSPGVHLFADLVARAARLAAQAGGFDAHLVETHHAAKQDAPSGTAVMLARRVAESAGREPPITSVRTGHVPGTHELLLDAPFEQLRLEHVARDRRVFADGALLAARWLAGGDPPRRGVFEMRDVLQSTETP